MAYYKDVREYLQALENSDKLVRIKQPINKDTELHPLVRLQYRGLAEADRRAFLFEKVVDLKGRSFDIPVAIACYAGNLDIYALGMQCKKDEIYDKWTRAQSRPIQPVEVKSAPCQERVIQGAELKSEGWTCFRSRSQRPVSTMDRIRRRPISSRATAELQHAAAP